MNFSFSPELSKAHAAGERARRAGRDRENSNPYFFLFDLKPIGRSEWIAWNFGWDEEDVRMREIERSASVAAEITTRAEMWELT